MQSQHSVAARMRAAAHTTLVGMAVALLVLAHPSAALAARVFIDPGHGGAYPGAVYAGVEEQYVNLLLGLETRRVLQARGHTVALSRTGDVTVNKRDIATWHWDDAEETYFLYADGETGAYPIPYDDLQARCDKANLFGADLFISIHNNAGGSATGTETYYNSWETATDAVLSKRLATLVQQEIVRVAGTTDRGVDDVGYYVIRWANMPAALIEAAFLSSSADRARLLSPAFRTKVAIGIANGVDRYMASNPYTAIEPRIQGADRYVTAAQAALAGWPHGAQTVILASGEVWPDSLAAAPLSAKLDAPVLLTPARTPHAAVAAAVERLGPSGIVVLGGTAAVARAVVDAAADAGGLSPDAVRRIAGRDRFETAALIAEEVGTTPGMGVSIVSGTAYPDAVSASAFSGTLGMPILLTETDRVSPHVGAYLSAHSAEVTSAVIVGGPAVVSRDVKIALDERVRVTRLWGADRYDTNVAVLKRFYVEGELSPLVATGENFPDALVAGALAAKRGQPVVLCGARYLGKQTRAWVLHRSDRIAGWTMVGGPGVLTHLLEWELLKARRTPPPAVTAAGTPAELLETGDATVTAE